MNLRRPAFVAAALCAPLFAQAQNTIFSDSFTADTLTTSTAPYPAYPAVTATSTGWAVATNKNTLAPQEAGGILTLYMAGTSSGFSESQALFAPAPVQLLPGTYIEVTGTFVPTFILTNSSDNLVFGLYNSGGSAPAFGMVNSQLSSSLSTFATGGAKGWLGYNGNIVVPGGTAKMLTRPAQTGTVNTVQDVVFDGQSGSVGYASSATLASTGTPAMNFTNGATYTYDYKLALSADAKTLTATLSVYNGVGTTGAGSNTLIKSYSANATGSTLLTTAFDALAIGWRADAGTSNPSNMKLSALTVRTTGGAPWFTAQPPTPLLVTIGDTVNIPATVAGVVGTLQWQKSTDNGATFSNIDTTANPSAATDTLTLANVQTSDAAVYRLVASNAAGSTASSNVTISTTTTPVPPSIITQPVSGTVQAPTGYTFKVVANGSSPLTYQWLKSTDGGATYNPIGGATSATYAISATTLADEGSYKVTVTNGAGSITSAAATLTVNQPLTITTNPVGATLNLGDTYTLQVIASGKPAPSSYQWFLNGSAIGGATNATYTIGSAAAANAGIYTVSVSNSVPQTVTSTPAAVAVLSSTLASTAATPGTTPTGVSPDSPLTLTFNQPVAVGLMGQIRIYDAANATTPVDTIDIPSARALMTSLGAPSTSVQALPVQTKTIGGVTNFHYYPITITGNRATIYPRNGTLTYGKTYFVQVDAGVFTDTTGLSFAGISGTNGWTFGTKQTGPGTGATWITVAADGSGDFATVQGALDYIPSGNTTARTIYLRKGTYFEEVYFTGKHNLTFLGEDRAGTVITYPNNNNFNNVGGTYHRMVLNADHDNGVVFANLTITNPTVHGGSQSEALIINGNTSTHAVVTNVDLNAYQDTLQINGSAYITNSHISGDTDFMWGNGPCFFENCELTELTSGGLFTQIRNGSGNHGYVFVHCTFDAAAGVSGTFFGRIDPTTNNFPYSEVAILDSTIGNATNNSFLNTSTGVSGSNYFAGWWQLNNVTSGSAAPNVHNWTNGLVDRNGAALTNPNSDTFTNMPTDATTQANYRNLQWVLNTSLSGTAFGSWTPAMPPIISTQPTAQTVNGGSGFTLSVQAFGVPAVSYQWLINGAPISGATDATYTVASADGTNAGMYSVVVSNGAGSATSNVVPLVVHGGPPVIALQPANTTGLLGADTTLNVWALGDGPLAYQWSKDGAQIDGATGQSLHLTALESADAGNYTVAVSNAGGTSASAAAALTLVAPATTLPTQPIIPAGTFDITAYGAVGDGVTDNTAPIQAAIAAANAAGGGTVEIPAAAAAYLSGPITLSSNTNFQIDGGAILRALPFGVYPRSRTSPSHFITVASGSTNVEFSGGGTVDGQGGDWWAAFNSGVISGRPRMVQITKATNVLFTGITFLNSPNFHLAFSGLNNNVTVFGVTISAPGDSPNTDGMDLAGTNFLVQNCSVSDGDDNVVAKPGSVFCRNLYVANCAFGTGHGVSVGGQTNVGMDGMTVTNCTFNGTDTGLRLKADATQGGPVQNVTFSNITMTNVTYPILFYSYYNQIGSPGAKSGSSQTTPAKVNAWNTSPPNSLASSTLPSWKNIVVSNLTATGAGGYSTIWGLPLANGLVNGVTLNNVNITGGSGLEVYDATNVLLTGSTNVGPIVTCNGLAITGQPQGANINVGQSVTFNVTAVGASGTAPGASTYQWSLNGAPLTDGPQVDGSTISGATTAALTITNARVTGAGNYTVTVSNTLDGYDVGTATLVPNSLPVAATSSAAALVVNPLPASITLSSLTQTYDGTALAPTVTTSPAGVAVKLTYSGGAAPVNAGSYTVTATIADPNYVGDPVTSTFVIQPAPATITLTNLSQPYDGQPKTVTAATSPASLAVAITYNGDSAGPVYPGQYPVVATIADPNYTGSSKTTLTITITALVRHAPTLNGAVDGSVQVVSPESIALGGDSWLSGDLLVPGTPNVVVNGNPVIAGMRTGPGDADPSNYTVTVSGNAVLRYLVRQVDAPAFPQVSAPAAPTGTRTVTINSAKQDPGDFATIGNLTLNGNAGDVVLPPGAYGQLTANGSSGFVLGHAGATLPDVYDVQTLTLNGGGHLRIAGPVVLVLANGVTFNGPVGDGANPDWLTIEVASGGVTVNGAGTVAGSVIAPTGNVILNGSATLIGEVVADRLTINGNAMLKQP